MNKKLSIFPRLIQSLTNGLTIVAQHEKIIATTLSPLEGKKYLSSLYKYMYKKQFLEWYDE